jgi:hypothetical protein
MALYLFDSSTASQKICSEKNVQMSGFCVERVLLVTPREKLHSGIRAVEEHCKLVSAVSSLYW